MLAQRWLLIPVLILAGLVGSVEPQHSFQSAYAASTYSQSIVGDGPVSYWRLGESSGTTAADSSSGGNTGTIKGGVTLGVPGAIIGDTNTAMSFDGTSGYVSVNDKANLDITGDLTVEAWVQPTSSDTTTHTVVQKGGAGCSTTATSLQYQLALAYVNSAPRWRATMCIGGTGYTVTDPSAVSTTSWTYLAMVRSGSTLTLYRNGTSVASVSNVTGSLNTSTAGLGIGRLASTAGNYFKGTIDEAAVYNKALSASQVLTHYTTGTAPNPTATPTSTPTPTMTSTPTSIPTPTSTPTVAPTIAPPAAPSNLTASTASTSEVDLSWTDLDPTVSTYEIDRSPDGVLWTVLTTTVPAGTTTYADTGLASGTTYWYRVEALNGGGSSGSSNSATATTLSPTPTTYSQTILGDSPISYWRLGELSGTTTADSSSGGNSGTIKGGVTLGVPGAIVGDTNTAMSFDGTSGYISVNDKTNLDITGDLTVEAWAQPTSSDTAAHTVVQKGGAGCSTTATSLQYQLSIVYANSASRWRGVVCIGGTSYTVTDPSAASTTAWTYLAMVRSGSTLTLYRNGTSVASVSNVTGSLNTSTAGLGIGRLASTSSNYFKGVLDEVAVYNKALSASQIQTDYTTGTAANPTTTLTPTSSTPTATVTSTPTPTPTGLQTTLSTVQGSTSAALTGSPVILTGIVWRFQDNSAPPGQLTLYDGSTAIATQTVDSNGVTTFTVTPTSGTHTYTVYYGGSSTPESTYNGDATNTSLPFTLSVDPTDIHLVKQNVVDLLGRFATSSDTSQWMSVEDTSGETAVASAIESTSEYQNHLITQFFDLFLNRAATSSEQQTYAAELASGTSDETVESQLAGSSEYFTNRGGGTNNGFLSALYLDVLHRAITSAEQTSWNTQLTSGMTTQQVAFSVLTSQESQNDLVSVWVDHLLRRAATSADLTKWTAQLQAGSTDEQVMANIVGTSEYLTYATSNPLGVGPLPLGYVVSNGPHTGCSTGDQCVQYTVTCPGVQQPVTALLDTAVATTSPARGVIVFFSGGIGDGFWAGTTASSNMLTNLHSNGYTTVQVKWPSGWWYSSQGEDVGTAHIACRPATMIKWIHDNVYVPLGISPTAGQCGFCITGNSGGASQVGLVTSYYDLESILDGVFPSSGPTHAAEAKGCLPNGGTYWYTGGGYTEVDSQYGFLVTPDSNGPCATHDTSWGPRWYFESADTNGFDYSHLHTRLEQIIGGADTGLAPAHAKDFEARLLADGGSNFTSVVLAGMPHTLQNSQDGVNLLYDIITAGTGIPTPTPIPTSTPTPISTPTVTSTPTPSSPT